MGSDAPGQVTAALLSRWNAGNAEALPALVGRFYSELRRVASAYLRHERADHTLQATALVHEAYMRMFQGTPFRWESRSQFFCSMARTMRQILVDYARGRNAVKRWDRHQRIALDDVTVMAGERPPQLMALDEALTELSLLNPRQGQVVELLWFVGLTREEAAAMLDVSAKTVQNDWRFARAWLQRRLDAAESTE
jgi:RNA polymerase sigma-70 factor (ECF subfamily)